MKPTTLTINLDADLKEKAEKVFSSAGLSLDSAIIMFLQKAVETQKSSSLIKENISFLTDDKIKEIFENIINKNFSLYKKLAEWTFNQELDSTFTRTKDSIRDEGLLDSAVNNPFKLLIRWAYTPAAKKRQ